MNIYHNGVYKGNTSNINFIGSIVDVVMGTVSGTSDSMANIIFDACGCSGTFGTYGYSDGFLLNGCIDVADWNGSSFEIFNLNPSDVTGADGGFSGITGSSYTYQAPYTGLYRLDIYRLTISVNDVIFLGHNDFDYDVTLHFGDKGEWNWSGSTTAVSVSCAAGGIIDEGSTLLPIPINIDLSNIFLQEGETISFYGEFSLTDNHPGGNFDSDTHLGFYIWCYMTLQSD